MALQIFGGGSAAAGGGGGGGLSLDSDGVPYFTVSGGDATAPTVPGTPVATGGNASASLAFTGSTDAVGVVGYRAYASTDSYTAVVASGATSPLAVTGLTNGTPVTFKVSAYDAAGNESAKSTASNSVTPSTGVTTLVSDNFNRANETPPLAGQIGPAPVVTPASGHASVTSNQLAMNSSGAAVRWPLGGVNDYTIQVTGVVAPGGIKWRYTDASNHYVLTPDTVYRNVGGTLTSKGAYAAWTAGVVIKIVASGNTHTIYRNGVQVLTFTDTANPTGEPQLQAADVTTRYDDLTITTP